MLAGRRVTTMLPVVDMARARDFYERALGLSPQGGPQPDGKVLYDCRGAYLALFPRGAATKAEHTALSFEVREGTPPNHPLVTRPQHLHDGVVRICPELVAGRSSNVQPPL